MALRPRNSSPWKWEAALGQWVQDNNPPKAVVPHSFTTLTYNVWFQDAKSNPAQFAARNREVFKVIRDADADVLCFQEATFPFVDLFMQQDWVQQAYWISDVAELVGGKQSFLNGTFTSWYGVVIASRIPIQKLSWAPFPNSGQGRCLLVAHLSMPSEGEQIALGSVHLESGRPAAAKRLQQLKWSCEYLATISQTGLLLGDFNIGMGEKPTPAAHWERNGWIDIDPRASTWTHSNWRPDHTLLRSHVYEGNASIKGDNKYGGKVWCNMDSKWVTTPSDHFAIKCHLTQSMGRDEETDDKENILCRYFAKGHCRDGDACLYLHNRAPAATTGTVTESKKIASGSVLCKYVAEGHSRDGDACPYLHDIAPAVAKGIGKGPQGCPGGHVVVIPMLWSLENTREIHADKVPRAQIFAGTEAPTSAVKMLNENPSMWPNSLGRCYVFSSYFRKWYLMWPGNGNQPPELADTSRVGIRQWSLELTARTLPERVNQSLIFKGTEAPTAAVHMLNSDRTLWPNIHGECYVWSAYKRAWYRLWAK